MELSRESFKEEVSRFRANFKEDAFPTAEKSITLEKRGNVGLIIFDQFQEKANKLSTPNMLRIFELLLQVEQDKDIKALVLISRKPSIFIAGADISEIQQMASGKADVESLMKLQAVPTYLENMSIPSVAAIHGAAMGGGLEITLACDYRMASDAPETKLALPEVMLGVLPGWGGTQRLPRLLGLEKSLDLILTGKSVDGKKAKKLGLVDKVVPKEVLEEKAVAWAAELAKAGKKRDKTHRPADLKEKILEMVPGGKKLVFDTAKKTVLSKTKGQYPAPLKALEVIRKSYGGSLEAGLKIEAKGFMELVHSPESAALISVFYLNERVKKDKGVDTGAKAKEVQRAGVLGAGVMGGGIAQLFAAKNLRVRMKDVQWDAIAKGFKAAHKVFEKMVERRKMKPNELANAMERIEGTTTYDGFGNVDLVVEAVVENMDIKKKVFQELEARVSKDAVLASNTSSLSISELASATKNPARVVGMHFFNPVDKMPLVEVIRGKDTSDEAVATVFQLSKKLGKTPIVVKDGPGFVVNRILTPYMNEAVHLFGEGVTPTRVDKVMEKFGMPMGPATLMDEVGLDVGSKVSKILYGAFGERMKPSTFMEKAVEPDRLGKKTGKGIYIWDKSGKKKTPDTAFWDKMGIKESNAVTDEQIVTRLTYVMVNEAARIIEEGLVRDISDIDVGMIYGTGFAPFRGGLLRYADSVGAEAIVADLELLARNVGPRFAPSAYLQQLAVSGKKFYA